MTTMVMMEEVPEGWLEIIQASLKVKVFSMQIQHKAVLAILK